jgi:hypothetical protein
VSAISPLDRPRAISLATSSSRAVRLPVAARLAGELLDEPAGDGRRQEGLAGGDDADGRDQVVGGGVLEQEPAGAGAERLVHVVVEVEGRQHQHPRPVVDTGGRVQQSPGGLQPVHHRHAHVHQDHVGPQFAAAPHRVLAVGDLAHHRHALLGVEQRAEPLAHHRLVVGEHDPDHRGTPSAGVAARGRAASTR